MRRRVGYDRFFEKEIGNVFNNHFLSKKRFETLVETGDRGLKKVNLFQTVNRFRF